MDAGVGSGCTQPWAPVESHFGLLQFSVKLEGSGKQGDLPECKGEVVGGLRRDEKVQNAQETGCVDQLAKHRGALPTQQ